MSWPTDADGDVFRALEADGFDFSNRYAVDYIVDFDNWPPAPAALEVLRSQYGSIQVFDPGEDGDGYVLFKVNGPVTYEGVTSVQRRASSAMQPFGGICESWGVMH